MVEFTDIYTVYITITLTYALYAYIYRNQNWQANVPYCQENNKKYLKKLLYGVQTFCLSLRTRTHGLLDTV